MRHAQSLPVAILAAALLLSSLGATHPQTSDGNCEYFGDTGHYVCDEFLEFYQTHGDLEIFGYPLTEAFLDPELRTQVQYFQRARMELHPRNPDPYKVQLGLLADELGYIYPPVRRSQIASFNSANQQYFPQTGHTVSYAFLDFFREKGGLDIFGYPRSEFMLENGYIVQYFQRARMEWHPEFLSSPRMRLANLGEIYLERFPVPGDYDEPVPPPATGNPGALKTLDIDASVRRSIVGRDGTQTVYVYVTDQRGWPVENAAVKMVVHYQTGDQRYVFEPTNARGFTSTSFQLPEAPLGRRVVIDVTAALGNEVQGETQSSFIPWW